MAELKSTEKFKLYVWIVYINSQLRWMDIPVFK